jgi:hypothetical protein
MFDLLLYNNQYLAKANIEQLNIASNLVMKYLFGLKNMITDKMGREEMSIFLFGFILLHLEYVFKSL